MKKLLASALACLLLCQGAASAAGGDAGQAWSRPEGDGSYITIRVPGEPGMALIDTFDLAVRYADTGEPVALSSAYLDGYLFATVPAENADRPLEVFRGDDPVWTDLREQYLAANGSSDLQIRGVVRGDNAGRLKQDAPLTRAEGAVLMARLLDLQPAERPGYSDVSPDAWYHEEVSAAAAAGLFAADGRFLPDQAMTRAEFTVLLARALSFVGWLDIPAEGDLSGTGLMDAESVPSWAAGAYQALFACNPGIAPVTEKPTGAYYWEDAPVLGDYAEPENPITRGEAITSMNQAMRWVPCYPTEAAIQFGLDREMPVIDGSTSTYPYTQGVYSVLFTNGTAHPQFPKSHSKSFASYERLIRGEADVLFAATKASAELESLAAEQGVELQYIPIAYDAMVFFTNLENPVNGLTRQQIQDIYVRNTYDNWNQVGGPDAGLLPYRRNADSGSHALMEQYFLEGGKLSLSPDVNNVLTSYAMSSALTDVAEAMTTDPLAYAMGYSVYYYYVNSYWLLGDSSGGDLKLLAVDGVTPSEATIADGSYPLAGYNYLVFRSDEPEDSPARRLAAYLLTEEGQALVTNAGFGALSQADVAAAKGLL